MPTGDDDPIVRVALLCAVVLALAVAAACTRVQLCRNGGGVYVTGTAWTGGVCLVRGEP